MDFLHLSEITTINDVQIQEGYTSSDTRLSLFCNSVSVRTPKLQHYSHQSLPKPSAMS